MPKTNHHTLSLSSIFFLLLLCSLPVYKDLMSNDAYVSTPPDADAFVNSAAYLGNESQIEASLTGQWSEYSSIISAGLSDAFEGKTTIEEAVKTIDEQANTTVFK